MKYLLLILFATLSFSSANSQHFKLFIEDKQQTFKKDNGSFHITDFDSVSTYGADKWFYNYKYNQDSLLNYTPCNYAILNSWLGNYFIEKPDGSYVFFNYNNDSIFIHTDTVQRTWKLMNLGANFIQASFNKQKTNDSTLFINFQAKDNNGINLNHPINNQEIIISKFKGIIKALDFYHLPHISVFTYSGSINPNNGITNLTSDSIFNYNVGDIFHTFSLKEFSAFKHYEKTETYSEWIITSKSGLNYTYSERKLQGISGNSGLYTRILDSINSKQINYIGGTLSEKPYINLNPHVDNTHWYELKNDTSLGSIVKEGLNFCSCISGGKYCSSTIYGAGIGKFSYTFSDQYFFNMKMVYYKKGSKTWGIPINFDSVLNMFLTGVENKVISNKIIIYPVPTKSEINILSEIPFETYCIISPLGEIIEMKKLENFYINISDLAKGLYFLKLINDNMIITKKFTRE